MSGWWSKRFVEVLESLGLGSGLVRGRRDARAGSVLSMSLSTSVVVAQVQGVETAPYRVRVGVKAVEADDWARVEEALASSAFYGAKLLGGELPVEIETSFSELGLSLFPATLRELSMDCSCPDWEVPCRHAAAVCSVLADSFDADPFQLLAWRGRGRDELLDGIRRRREDPEGDAGPADGRPLAQELDSFWVMHGTAGALPEAAGKPDALLDRLDPLGVTLRGSDIVELLRPAYRAMAAPEQQNPDTLG
jgi:uncharacterized Zn finger protein